MFRPSATIIAGAALAAMASGAQAATVYALSSNPLNGAVSLIRFDSATPGAVTTLGAISGDTNSLSGLDFRPLNGVLYGVNAANSSIYSVNIANGMTSFVSTLTGATLTNPNTGIDFNPTVDRLRLVNPADQNLRVNIANGAATVDTSLGYAGGGDANIVDAAYTNNDNNPATGTQIYYIDYVLDTLITSTTPNTGPFSSVGPLGVDTGLFTGFDIYTDGSGGNTAYAALSPGGVSSFYTVNLNSGAASLVGLIGASNVFGVAVAVPEPGSLALLGLGGLAAFAARRRGAGRTERAAAAA